MQLINQKNTFLTWRTITIVIVIMTMTSSLSIIENISNTVQYKDTLEDTNRQLSVRRLLKAVSGIFGIERDVGS